MSWPNIVARLAAGEKVELHPSGSSMEPLIHSKQRVLLEPFGIKDIKIGAIVLAKVKGRFYLHKITRISGQRGDRVLISNNKGHDNGWTSIEKVYGVVTEIG